MLWSQVIGFIVGVAASVVGWFFLAAWLVPRLEISGLNRFPDSGQPCGYRYRIKIVNRSRRAAVDLTVHARLVFKGLDSKRPEVQTSLVLPVASAAAFPVLGGIKTGDAVEDRERVYTLHIHELAGAAIGRLPEDIVQRLESRTARLEDLLNASDGGFVRLAVSTAHELSGFRKTYLLRLDETEEGSFVDGSIEIASDGGRAREIK